MLAVSNMCVAEGLKTNLLSLPAIPSLNLVARVQSISSSHLTVFKSLLRPGNSGEWADAKPYTLHTAIKVPISLQKMYKLNSIEWMESFGVIFYVDEWSPWYTGMVVEPKPSGKEEFVSIWNPWMNMLWEFYPLLALWLHFQTHKFY